MSQACHPSYLVYEAEPSVIGVANAQHPATLIEVKLSQPPPLVLELVAALHPMPPVSGWPREMANAWITDHVGFDRGRYAGTLDWIDGRGNDTWAVSIRCAEVHGTTARLFARNGIPADSDPANKLAETQASSSPSWVPSPAAVAVTCVARQTLLGASSSGTKPDQDI